MRILQGPILSRMTTLKLGGRAIAEVVVEHERDLDGLDESLRALGGEPMALGAGSNILAADHDLPYVLVRVALSGQPRASDLADGSSLVLVPAGMRLPRLLGWLRMQGLRGLEELTGIPGSLGGAVAMNAGSYGREMDQVLQRVLVWSPLEGTVWTTPGQWRAGYRFFDAGVAGHTVLILAVELLLKRDDQNAIRARMQKFYTRKKSSQPVTMASAGCVFKNPSPQQPAGMLLEQVGLRGRRVGNMAFSEQHANFLVNLGKGQSEQALELMETARTHVRERFGLDLETEIKVVS